jgi:hypothetical protein
VTNQERELASLGIEYAEGIERARVVIIPSTGREVRKTDRGTWEVQPRDDNYWREFGSVVEAVRFGTRPKD